MTAREAYEARRAEAKGLLTALDRRGALLANLRTVTFLAGLVLLGLTVFEKLPRIGLLGAAVGFGAFVGLAIVHAAVIREERRRQVLLAINERGLARLDGKWHDFAEKGEGHLPEGHLNASDLDLVGQGSLFQLIDETGTRAGEAQLVGWLGAEPPPADEVKERQAAVQELSALLDFRQSLVTEARMASEAKADPSKFIAWAEAPSLLKGIGWAYPLAHLLPLVTLGGAVAGLLDLVSPLVFYAGLAAQIAVVQLTKKPLNALFEALMAGDRGFVRFEGTFRAIDAQTFTHPALRALQAGLTSQGKKVSERLERVAKLLGLFELKLSGNMHPVINVLFLWDIHVSFRVEKWRLSDGVGVRGWFDALARLEALSSFAGFAFERPDACYPEVVDGPARFEATALGHPLLDAPVRNGVTLPSPGHALVITGSNMSGKTTLMRAMGLNAVMALAGLPVCARSLTVSRLTVMTSMRLKDSLERGVSYFYAEVQRIRSLLDTAAAKRDACLFLLDELFMGTNTRERQIASRQLMLKLLDLGAIGAVTTHDLSICELEKERPGQVKNVHFRDQIDGGEMTFDYTLREGVVETSNALEVLKRAGVPLG